MAPSTTRWALLLDDKVANFVLLGLPAGGIAVGGGEEYQGFVGEISSAPAWPIEVFACTYSSIVLRMPVAVVPLDHAIASIGVA